MLPLPLLGGCAVWLAVVATWRYVSAGSILAAVAVPVFAAILAYPPPMTGAAIGISLLVLYRHRGNMQRLLQGRELKF
jgi:acyl phosphate:glycerol-3-phosphate acyltransferase